MIDTWKRSAVKATIWRVCGFIFATFVAWWFTSDIEMSLGISALFNSGWWFAYFAYERLWDRISWGRTPIDLPQLQTLKRQSGDEGG